MSNISEQLVNDIRERTGMPPIREPKYKVGDKIKIVESEAYSFTTRKLLKQLDPPFVVTIKKTASTGYYYIEENDSCWWRDTIESLYIEPIPVKSRWEILDIR